MFIQILVKGKGRSRAHSIPKSSGLKKLVRGVASKKRRTVARQAILDPGIRSHVFMILKKVQKEMTRLSSKSFNSLLGASSAEALTAFTWEKLAQQISHAAPTLYAVLDACVDVKRRRSVEGDGKSKTKAKTRARQCSSTAILGVCAGILLRHRNHHMNLVQRLVALVLHSGHSAKQVSTYICTSVHIMLLIPYM